MKTISAMKAGLARFASRVVPATKSDARKIESLIMGAKEDLTTAVDKLIAKNDALLALLQNVQNGSVAAADIQVEIDKLNAESAKDDAANPPATT